MSDAIQTTPSSRILFNDRRFLDDDVLDGDVLVKAFACRLDLFDLVDDIGAFDHLAEYRVAPAAGRSEEHTSELQSLMRISYAVFCLKKKTNGNRIRSNTDLVLF